MEKDVSQGSKHDWGRENFPVAMDVKISASSSADGNKLILKFI